MKHRRLLVVLLTTIALSCGFALWKLKSSSNDVPKGMVEDDSLYVNEGIGLEMPIPTGWSQMPSEELPNGRRPYEEISNPTSRWVPLFGMTNESDGRSANLVISAARIRKGDQWKERNQEEAVAAYTDSLARRKGLRTTYRIEDIYLDYLPASHIEIILESREGKSSMIDYYFVLREEYVVVVASVCADFPSCEEAREIVRSITFP